MLISTPGITVSFGKARAASSAAGMPATESWSVRAIYFRPSPAAIRDDSFRAEFAVGGVRVDMQVDLAHRSSISRVIRSMPDRLTAFFIHLDQDGVQDGLTFAHRKVVRHLASESAG